LKEHYTNVKGLEINLSGVVPEAKDDVEEGDATRMHFADESFEILYCYHVLEHIVNPAVALGEMKRVLKRGGILYLGVPNKSRLFSYLFVRDKPLRTRLLWNFIDYQARLLGKFENRFSAHAGFTSVGLTALLESFFPNVQEVTHRYYSLKYPNSSLVRCLLKAPSFGFIWPSIYFICRK
jgi:SAM-dependent methyltransferase